MIEEFDDQSIRQEKDFYASLKEQLETNHNFPEDYLFKFIFLNDQSKLTELYQVFDGIKYTISTRDSKNQKYLSASIQAFVLSADHVIELYKKAANIEGIMML